MKITFPSLVQQRGEGREGFVGSAWQSFHEKVYFADKYPFFLLSKMHVFLPRRYEMTKNIVFI